MNTDVTDSLANRCRVFLGRFIYKTEPFRAFLRKNDRRMIFSVCENTNLKEKDDKFGDMQVVHCYPALFRTFQMTHWRPMGNLKKTK